MAAKLVKLIATAIQSYVQIEVEVGVEAEAVLTTAVVDTTVAATMNQELAARSEAAAPLSNRLDLPLEKAEHAPPVCPLPTLLGIRWNSCTTITKIFEPERHAVRIT